MQIMSELKKFMSQESIDLFTRDNMNQFSKLNVSAYNFWELTYLAKLLYNMSGMETVLNKVDLERLKKYQPLAGIFENMEKLDNCFANMFFQMSPILYSIMLSNENAYPQLFPISQHDLFCIKRRIESDKIENKPQKMIQMFYERQSELLNFTAVVFTEQTQNSISTVALEKVASKSFFQKWNFKWPVGLISIIGLVIIGLLISNNFENKRIITKLLHTTVKRNYTNFNKTFSTSRIKTTHKMASSIRIERMLIVLLLSLAIFIILLSVYAYRSFYKGKQLKTAVNTKVEKDLSKTTSSSVTNPTSKCLITKKSIDCSPLNEQRQIQLKKQFVNKLIVSKPSPNQTLKKYQPFFSKAANEKQMKKKKLDAASKIVIIESIQSLIPYVPKKNINK